MADVKLDKYNLIFDMYYENYEGGRCFVPQPNEIELKSLSHS